ncbi:NUDIX hydrolase [Stackebrandtia nassauensis]|uniref:Putative phosphohistidine phosphatase, SixA n=1 Tax=Stackebrandtia nassauensis (strain DSM 44728 / CIP 108903 / NRRL B-16338 / NBRC 102104 / LLR-40K-21) TaxID=446470 RepID=D3Q9T6_STANL|nr:NUDIX domain-containing protein [Stackebrandtia nassauensis]ADD44632.1 putative phosphohistidine phosphatase, SixA [Stackebrandtia nassauensis DSM 44728]
MNDRVLAAGGVLWRPAAPDNASTDTVEVAGVYRPETRNWSLPKGKLDDGEHPLSAACREVAEETGLTPIPQAFLVTARYTLPREGGEIEKIVDYWSMRALDERATFTPTAEVTEQRWFGLAEAEKVLTRPRDQVALGAFRDLPRVTATVLLLRHAQAEPETAYPGADVARPLNATGRGDSARLVPLLALYNPHRIVAATPLRCVKTVTPLSAALGLEIQGEEVFDATGHPGNPERAAARLRELATGGGGVVCSQLPVIADSLAILADTDGVAMPSVHTPPGGVWVLSFSHKTLVAAERLSV